MIDEGRLQQEIIDHEGGVVLKPYKDHLGYWTVGVGHLIKDSEKHEFKDGITYETGLKLFLIDYSIAKRDMQTFLKPCGDMPNIVQEVCLEMAFQKAGGYNNLPNGNFSSVIYSKKTQNAFRKATVASVKSYSIENIFQYLFIKILIYTTGE